MKKIDFTKIKKIHFIGIGGIGLSAVAKLMLARGKIVSGSDINESEITDELKKIGAKISIGQRAENLTKDIELVIYTLAISEDNSELAKAKKLKIPLLTYPEALGKIFNDKYGIAVCGTHGKSTTASLVGLILAVGGLDPSVLVGSKVPEFQGNLRIGASKYFVIEACEYERAFLEYWPKIIILNNIELDHTDYYKNIEDYKKAFGEFIGHLPKNGVWVCNGDDKESQNLKQKIQKYSPKIKIMSFGFSENNDIRGYDIKIGKGKVKFKVKCKGSSCEIPLCGNFATSEIISQGEFTLKIPGKFNVYNALAAIAVGLRLGVDVEKIKKTLVDFGGTWRRFEVKGECKNATVISDYAHHPTAVKATVEAARQFYPGRRIVVAFQPHQHNRTKLRYNDFGKSFASADALILAEIFDVAGREEKKDKNISSQNLAEDIKKRNKKMTPNIFYAKDLDDTRKLIDEKIMPGDIVLVMGAGDIYKVADKLVKK